MDKKQHKQEKDEQDHIDRNQKVNLSILQLEYGWFHVNLVFGGLFELGMFGLCLPRRMAVGIVGIVGRKDGRK